jgi:hypothetical protein
VKQIKLFCPSGKSLPIIGNRVKPQNQKYFAFPEGANLHVFGQPGPHEGAFRDRHDALGGAAVDAFVQARFLRVDD